VNEWRKIHLSDLLKAWEDAQNMRQPKKIKPLE